MAHWSDRYIGIPYVPKTADCASLVERVAREVFGLQILLPANHETQYRRQARQINEHRDNYAERIENPVDGCVALFKGKAYTCHIGVMCWINGGWWVLHAVENKGSVRQRLRDVTLFDFELEGFYKWI